MQSADYVHSRSVISSQPTPQFPKGQVSQRSLKSQTDGTSSLIGQKCKSLNISAKKSDWSMVTAASPSESSMNLEPGTSAGVIHHFHEDLTNQISILFKGCIEISGPPLDYQEFFWRAACAAIYDLTRGHDVGRPFQYLISSLLYHRVTSFGHIFTISDDEHPPLVECTSPFEIKGYTEYNIVKRTFPRLNLTSHKTIRYVIKSGIQLRIDFNLKLQSCLFSDRNRDMARLKDYQPLGAPSTQNYTDFFNKLEDLIENTGCYNFLDISRFIAADITALDSPKEDDDGHDNSFIGKIKRSIGMTKKPGIQDVKISPDKMNSLVLMSTPQKKNGQLTFNTADSVNRGDKDKHSSYKGLGWSVSLTKMTKDK